MTAPGPSPIVAMYDELRALNASWHVEVTEAASGVGWIAGRDLYSASTGPLNELLLRIGERMKTGDRRTIAASFALRYGWASAMAIAPYLRFRCVPDVALKNVSFKFRESTFLERTAIHAPRGTVVAGDERALHPSLRTVADDAALLHILRVALVDQATPVVDALHDWSGFAPRGSWGLLTSSWAAHFTAFCETPQDQRSVLPTITAFFAGTDLIAAMQPRLHPVTYLDTTHLYQRRSSCCRYYLLPQGDLCTSCPLVSHDDRVERNLDWMRRATGKNTTANGRSHG